MQSAITFVWSRATGYRWLKVVVVLLLIQSRLQAQSFSDVSSLLPNRLELRESSVGWGDYDNDGRLDLILTGYNVVLGSGPTSQLYRNTSSGFVDVTASQLPNLPQVERGSVAWGDYDNDGRLDLLITGSTGSSNVSKLYHNTATGFVDVTTSQFTSLPQVSSSSVAWGDYDSDGKLDLLLIGYTASSRVSQLYRNTGSGFVDVTASQFTSLPGAGEGSVAWGDYDNDGRLDLLFTGYAGGTNYVSRLYRNTGSGFEDVTNSQFTSLPQVVTSAVAWGDYDNDGRLDLIFTGQASSGFVSRLYHNTATGFVDVTTSQLPGLSRVFYSSVAWGDYDNDGRLDLLITGSTGGSGTSGKLYRNTGSGFEDVTASQLPGLSGVVRGAVAWGDYDNDGKLDLIYTGSSPTCLCYFTKLYRNQSPTANAAPAAPTSLSSSPGSDATSVRLSWQVPTDDHTPQASLSYNLYVSDSPTSQTVVGAMADLGTGYRRVVRLGNSQPTSFTLTGLSPGQTYYWSVQALDGAFVGGAFAAPQSFTTPAFSEVSSQLPNLPGMYLSAVAWGDYDNDGRLDLILTGSIGSSSVSKLYRNTASGFVDVTASQFTSLPRVYLSSVTWGDYDNDGRLDLLITGSTGSSNVSKLYHNTGSGFVDVTTSQFATLPQVAGGAVAWGDYDNDGRLDLILTGFAGVGYVSKLYRNTGTGFVDVTASQLPTLPQVYLSAVAWGDYDSDGRLDLILTGQASSGYVSQLYHNTGSGFMDATASLLPGLPGVRDGSVAWGDYDNDGRLDLLITGFTGNNVISQLYHNTGNGFADVTASQFTTLPGVAYSSVAWGDYDNDGKLDLILTGFTLSGDNVSKLYRNTGNDFADVTAGQLPGLPQVYRGSVAWGDYDNDGKLDLIFTGNTGSSNVSQLYQNLSPKANVVPDAPTSLTSTPSPDGTSVSLNWQAPTQADETPPVGLSYNLYVSDSPTSQTVVGAMADLSTGFRRVVRLGNSQPTSFTLTGLTPGQTYYWSVQALDAAFAGSPFAAPQSFVACYPLQITAQPVSGSSVCEGASVMASVSVSGTAPFTYQWYKDGALLTGVASATATRLSLSAVTAASAGAYLVVINSPCGSLTSTAFSLTVNAPPTASLVSSGTLTCVQTSVTLTAGGAGADGTYAFQGPNGPLASSGNQVVASVAGLYSVTATSASGCVSTTQTSVESSLSLAAPSLIASATATINQPISVTASGCAGGSINWNLLGGSGSVNGNIYTISQPGSYTLSASCSLNGCTSPVVSLTLSIQPDPVFRLIAPIYDCQTGAITFNTQGGDGSLIEYFAIGITGWSPNAHQTVSAGLREDPKKVVLMARQSGLTVSYRFDLPAFCAGLPTPPQSSTNPEPVLLQRIGEQMAYQQQSYRFNLPAGTFADPQGEALTYYVLGLPPGLSFVGTTISGTPTQAGQFTVTVIAVDPLGQTANTSFGLVVGPPVADLTVLVYLRPTLVYGSSAVSVVVDVVELNGVASSGLIRVRIPKVSQLSLSFDPTLGQNQGWSFSGSNASYYELTTSQGLEGGARQQLVLSGVFSPGATSGILSVSVLVLGGGEARLTNNADADKLEYFQQ